MSKFAIHQPNYLPWWGYFSKIASVDYFLFLDHVVFPQGKSFTSRVQIRTPDGIKWLTVPVERKTGLSIKDVKIIGNNWKRKHKKTLQLSYQNSKNGYRWIDLVQSEIDYPTNYLSDFNINLIVKLARHIGMSTTFYRTSDLRLPQKFNSESIVKIAEILGAETYLSGNGLGSVKTVNKEYLQSKGIQLQWQDDQDAMGVLGDRITEADKKLSIVDALSLNEIYF